MDLVTGGAGFIGSHLVEELVARGRPVRVLDDFSAGRLDHLDAVLDRVEIVAGDIRDLDTVRAAMRGVERVFHQAALRSVPRSVEDPRATDQVNVQGTLNVLVAAGEAGVRRVVYASSSSVYGDGPTMPQREDQPPAPLSPYAVSKLAGEHYCRVFARLYGLGTVSLRYFNVFGPRQDPDSMYAAVIARFIQLALRGESLPVEGDGLQSRDFTHVRNVVLANCLAAECGAAGEVFNVAGGVRHSVLDVVERLARLLAPRGIGVRWHHVAPRAGDVRHTLADIERARHRLGYRVAVDFAAGLRDTLAAALGAAVEAAGPRTAAA